MEERKTRVSMRKGKTRQVKVKKMLNKTMVYHLEQGLQFQVINTY